MSAIDYLKKNKTFRIIGKKINIRRQFHQDAKDFSKHFLYSAEKQKDYRYSILLIVHSLEKGMCFSNPRPFGSDKVKELIQLLENYSKERRSDFEYKLGISVLQTWLAFFQNHNWDYMDSCSEVKEFLKDKDVDKTIVTGAKEYIPIQKESSAEYYEKYFLSRHSVRDYKDKEIDWVDIEFALRCFVETPTACNRQMCRVIYIKDPGVKELLNHIVIGIPGFNINNIHYIIILYDLAAFAYSGERQQGLFNAGLCTMNLINGLHAKGIGSCCLQWSNRYSEDKKLRSELSIRPGERIGVIIGAGYYLEKNTIPCSVRRRAEDVFSVI